MAKNTDALSPEQAAALVGTLSATPAAPESQASAIQTAVLELLLADLTKKRKLEQEKEHNDKASRDYNISQLKLNEEQVKANQANCPHTKPNSHPAIAGQRDHRMNYHWICLYCQKQWINNELPIGLRIPMDRVGGPQLS